MTARTIAIGDIHGCAAALVALLDEIRPTVDDTIVTLGDYIDRGPESRRVIELLIDLAGRCQLVPLLGNHELMLLMALEEQSEMDFWLYNGGVATEDSYDGSVENIPDEHLEFLRGCRNYHETAEHQFVHANYVTDLPLDEQPERLLLWEHINRTVPAPHESGKTTIVGHTPQIDGEILDAGHVICIDTYCFGNGWLTALEVQTGDVWQADKSGTLRPQS